MSMFDYYRPASELRCPVCVRPLREWQGKVGPRRSEAAPTSLCSTSGSHAAPSLAPLVSRIDWSTLQVTDGHYVDEELATRQSDLLYTAKLDGHPVGLYLLFEHQSTPDPLMAFRLLRYMVRIWDRWLGDHPSARTLPVIVPVVLAHAEDGWHEATSMGELYALPSELLSAVSGYVPMFAFVLDDLSRHTDEELRSRALAALGEVALGLFRWGRSGEEWLARLTSSAAACCGFHSS